VGKDVRLVGEEVSEWRERKGRRLKNSMIAGVYDRYLDVLVIGIGVYGAVKRPREVRKTIHEHGISELILKPTPEACATYNELFHRGEKVALLAHGTC